MSRVIRPEHVAIYIRWSTDDQSQGTTLHEQRDGCENYVRSQGWQVRADLVFVDDGFSGGNLDRPAMARLRRKVLAGEVDCVVVLKLDRLSRNIVDAVQLVLREWSDRCYIKSAREPIDTTTDLGRVIFSMLASFADFERAQIRDRTQSGKERRIREGRQMHGEPAYGYQLHASRKGVWVENPAEAGLVRRIFRMARDGISANEITRRLNQEGCRTRAGRNWSLHGVLHILHNRTYIGEVVYGATSLKAEPSGRAPAGGAIGALDALAAIRPHRKRVRVCHGQPKIQMRTEAVVPLIDLETFRCAQERLQASATRRAADGSRSLASPHLLVGLARCPCGGSIIYKAPGGARVRESGRAWPYYRCQNARQGTCTFNSGQIPVAAVDQAISAHFLRAFGLYDLQLERFRPHLATCAAERTGLIAALRTAESRLRQLDAEERQLQGDARAGRVDPGDLHWLREGLERERTGSRAQVEQLQQQLAELDAAVERLEGTLTGLQPVERWERLSMPQKRQLLQLVLRERMIIVKPKGTNQVEVSIPWAY